MNIGKSIKIAVAKNDMKHSDLATKLGISSSYLSQMIKKTSCSESMLNRLSGVFSMKASEFNALGE